MVSAATRLDVRGLNCSDAVVRLHKALHELPAGALVRVEADDAEVLVDLKKYAARGGHAWEGSRTLRGGLIEAEVRKGA